MILTSDHRTTISTEPPSAPRLQLDSEEAAGRRLLDGGWWPRSTDPVAELPGLLLALDSERGPITHVMLARVGWDVQPRRLGVGDHVVRLGWFTSQPISLLTATRGNGDRVDLLVVPPDTSDATAKAAMEIAAQADNTVHAPEILAAAERAAPTGSDASDTAEVERPGAADTGTERPNAAGAGPSVRTRRTRRPANAARADTTGPER